MKIAHQSELSHLNGNRCEDEKMKRRKRQEIERKTESMAKKLANLTRSKFILMKRNTLWSALLKLPGAASNYVYVVFIQFN